MKRVWGYQRSNKGCVMGWTPDEEMPELAANVRKVTPGRLWCTLIGAVLTLALLAITAFSAELPGVPADIERIADADDQRHGGSGPEVRQRTAAGRAGR